MAYLRHFEIRGVLKYSNYHNNLELYYVTFN